jgi:hypothetical protein
MARWEEVYDHQVDLFTFWSTPTGRDFARGYIESVRRQNPDEEKAIRSIYGDLAERAKSALIGADPIWVSPDMMTLVEGAAKTFVPEPLHDSDLITERGFAWLPRPLWMTDIHGLAVSYRAISWFPASYTFVAEGDTMRDIAPAPGIFLMLYHYAGDPDDYAGDTTGRVKELEREFFNLAGGSILTHVTPWVYGQGYPDSERRDSAVPRDMEFSGLGEIARWVQVLFRLMSQTICVTTRERPSKPFRKRWAKAGLKERLCVVVTLRRHREDAFPADPEERHVEWTHRWLVSGHWRNQWYPSLSLHRQVWITPYIKGPEEAPLVIRPVRVFKLAR